MAMTLSCKICDRQYDNKILLEVHNSVYHRDETLKGGDDGLRNCPHCGQVLTRNDSLFRHILNIHYKLKQYKCPICNRAFASSYNMKQHIFSHSDTYEFNCPRCPKNFKTKRNVVKHLKRSHDLSKRELDKICMDYRLGIKDSRNDITANELVENEVPNKEFRVAPEDFKYLNGFNENEQNSLTSVFSIANKKDFCIDYNANKSQNTTNGEDSLNGCMEYKPSDTAVEKRFEKTSKVMSDLNESSNNFPNGDTKKNVHSKMNDMTSPILLNTYIDLNDSTINRSFACSVQNYHNLTEKKCPGTLFDHVNKSQIDFENRSDKIHNRFKKNHDRTQGMNDVCKLITESNAARSVIFENNNKIEDKCLKSNHKKDKLDNTDINQIHGNTKYRFLNSTDANNKLPKKCSISQDTHNKNGYSTYYRHSKRPFGDNEQVENLVENDFNVKNVIFGNQIDQIRDIYYTESDLVNSSKDTAHNFFSRNMLLEKLTELHNMGGEFDGFKQDCYEALHSISPNSDIRPDQSLCVDIAANIPSSDSRTKQCLYPFINETPCQDTALRQSLDDKKINKLTSSSPLCEMSNKRTMPHEGYEKLAKRSLSPVCIPALSDQINKSLSDVSDEQPMVYILED